MLIGALDVFELSEKVARFDGLKVKRGNLGIFQTKIKPVVVLPQQSPDYFCIKGVKFYRSGLNHMFTFYIYI